MKAALVGAVNWVGSFGAETKPKARDGVPPASARRAASVTTRHTAEPEPVPVPDPPGAWTAARLRFTNALWGEGYIGPGGDEEALRLCKPLGLQSSHSLLNIGAGLGGAARAITAASGAWVSAYEADPILAAAGDSISKRLKVEKKAEVKPFEPSAPKFRANYYHHALVQEALWMVPQKEALLTALVSAVKPAGQVVITDLTLGDVPLDPSDPSVAAWMRLDRSPVHLLDAKAETTLFARHGLDVRIAEEISERHMAQAIAGWREMIAILRENKPTAAQALTVVSEAELWLRRLALIRTGRLKLMRWHAMRR